MAGLGCVSMETGTTSPRNGRQWFTAKEAADFIGVHIDTLYSYTRLRKNRPPHIKLGNDRRYRFPKEQFIQWANGSPK
jgi:excisionase family DNA binding protein